MSDVRHYVRAREHLENDMTEASHDGATLNAQLAVSVAVRETCGELRNSLNGIKGRLQDLKPEPPDANLVAFTLPGADHSPIWINPAQVVVAVASDVDGITTIHTGIGRDFSVDADLNTVVGKLGVSL